MKDFESLGLRRRGGKLELLDQTRLPKEEVWHHVASSEQMIGHIQSLAVRGAPLIGVAAAAALAGEQDGIREKAKRLREARPTAVNLMHAMDRMLRAHDRGESLAAEADAIFEEDVELCRRMGERAAAFLQDGDGILTHCNTGGLATAGIGTALGAIRTAHESGKRIHVYVDETRPLWQGSRLTAWELGRLKIPFTLICDNMAASLMASGKVQHVIVGSDRIAANGDVANKIGTYSLAVNAHYHQIPFMVVAPSTTFDPACPDGAHIPIEERKAEEVDAGKAPIGVRVWNPAFDVTPRALVGRIVLEDRVW